jgi:hypothetical protein
MQIVWDPPQADSASLIPFIRFAVQSTNWPGGRIGSSTTTRAEKIKSLFSNVTDVVSTDAFDCISAGRSAFRVDDPLELRLLFDRRKQAAEGYMMCKVNIATCGKGILPHRPNFLNRPQLVNPGACRSAW